MSFLFLRLLGVQLMNEADAGGSAPAPAVAPAPDVAPAAPAPSLMGSDPAAPAPTAEVSPTAEQLASMTPEERAAHDAKATEAQKPVGAPEKYEDFKVADGLELAPEVMGEFSKWAKSNNISQEAAQQLIDLQGKLAGAESEGRAERLQQALDAQRTGWEAQIKSDPEFGGDKFPATMETASKAMQAFGTPELRMLLNESGIGSHPELVKLFHRMGTALTEDKMVLPGNQVAAPGEKSIEDRLWGAK